MHRLSLILDSLETTEQWGRAIGRNLPKGSIVLLWGQMGSGKTTLVKAICSGLGVNPEVVISPTYTIVNRYPGKFDISHVDLFRIENTTEMDDFDREDLILNEGLTLVEWPRFLKPWIQNDAILEFQLKIRSESSRELQIERKDESFHAFFHSMERFHLFHTESGNHRHMDLSA